VCLGQEGLWRASSQGRPLLSLGGSANKHKPWIEAEYQGIVMENDNTVLLNPPLFALDKDAPLRYAGNRLGPGKAGRTEGSGQGHGRRGEVLRVSNEDVEGRPWEHGRSRLPEGLGDDGSGGRG